MNRNFTTLLVAILAIMAAVLILTLTGCATDKGVVTAPVGSGNDTVNFDRRLLTECKQLPKLPDAQDTTVVNNYGQFTQAYAECARAKHLENQEVRKAFNIKD
jgi:hypothetical protein